MLTVKNLTKEFNTAGNRVSAVRNVAMNLDDGVFAAIVGKSGSGKTTLLSLLGALDKPTSGSIEVDGEEITKLGDWKLVKYRAKKIGFVFQSYNLIPNLTALENVMLPMEFNGIRGGERKKRAIELLKQVGLDETKHKRKPTNLSGGEQQRVAIARSLANKPSLILADEPTGNLDTQTGQLIIELLANLAKKEKTTITIVTHDPNIAKITHQTFTMRDGLLTKE